MLSFVEATSVTIEGTVPTDSTKFEFTNTGTTSRAAEAAQPVVTYVQTGDTGIAYSKYLFYFRLSVYKRNFPVTLKCPCVGMTNLALNQHPSRPLTGRLLQLL